MTGRADPAGLVVVDDVSKFYGEVLGINGVRLEIPPGITSLVGPNGSGKTTLMSLVAGLLRPTRGSIRVLGIPTDDPVRLGRVIGYCTQFDAFPPGVTGFEFVAQSLRLRGLPRPQAESLAVEAIDRVGLREASTRRVAAYSKGMRQRIRLAQAIAHDPRVLLLDEPLNGLDPVARAEVIALFQAWGREGRHVILSSHILHEVDVLSDRLVLIHHGYVVADGAIDGVRGEMESHPMQVLVRCADPSDLASRIFALDSVVEARLHDDHRGLLVRTRDADRFYRLLNRLVVEHGVDLEEVAPVDDDAQAVYRYLIEQEGRS